VEKMNAIKPQKMTRLSQAKTIYKYFNYSFYWLAEMVHTGFITETEAGYIFHTVKR
jgi:hypothetical protein